MNKDVVLESLLNDKDVYKTLDYLRVVLFLLRKYWRKLLLPEYIKEIEKINKDVVDLIYLLEGIKLLNIKDLSRFIRELKVQFEKKYLDFTLYSNDESTIEPLKNFLEKKFWKESHLVFEKIPSDNLTVLMKGHGYLFDRSLESDIDKLLE